MFFLYLMIGLVSGFGSSFLGIGAGVFVMPALLILGTPYLNALHISLIVVAISSLASAINIARKNSIDWRGVFIM